MKRSMTFALILVVLAALLLPGAALAGGFAGGLPDEFVTGTYTLDEGETLSGNLFIMGGNATLAADSHVTGDVMMVGGNLSVDGKVDGNLVATGGNVELKDDAVIGGDVRTIGAHLERDSQAIINGIVETNPRAPFTFTLPGGVRAPVPAINFNPFFEMIYFFGQAFLLAALAVLAVMFWPARIAQTAQAAVSQPLVAGGLGLLTVPAALAAMVVLLITIILSPASLLLALGLAVAALFGWIALGLEVGQRTAQMFNREWALPVSAGVGTLVLSLVAGGVGRFVDCVGWMVPAALGLVGLGAVLLTRFGMQPYPGNRMWSLTAPRSPASGPIGTAAVVGARPVQGEGLRPAAYSTEDFPPAPVVQIVQPSRVDVEIKPAPASDEPPTPTGGAAVFPNGEADPPAQPDGAGRSD